MEVLQRGRPGSVLLSPVVGPLLGSVVILEQQRQRTESILRVTVKGLALHRHKKDPHRYRLIAVN